MADHKVHDPAPPDPVEDVPDPDEDDLDDLDDMLDDFSATNLNNSNNSNSLPPHSSTPASGPGRPPPLASSSAATAAPTIPPPHLSSQSQPPTSSKDELSSLDATEAALLASDDDFTRQLQAGMAELMGEIESSPEMQAQFEAVFNQLGAAAASTGTEALQKGAVMDKDFTTSTGSGVPAVSGGGGADTAARAEVPDAASAATTTTTTAEPSFQDTIRKTMQRMQTSGDQATAAAATAGGGESGSEDFLEQLLKGAAGGEGGGAGASEEDFSKMLEGMMEQLTNKEILYEPMKELDDKFPAWLEKHDATLSKEDRDRYATQQGLVREIVGKFESKTYSDGNAGDRQYIVEKMQQMQAAGSPPPDLVGDMPLGADSLGMPDGESCNPQ